MSPLSASYVPDCCSVDSTKYFQPFFKFILYESNTVAEVFPGEALAKLHRLFHLQLFLDICTNLWSSRGGQCQHGNFWMKWTDQRYFQIRRTEIISPLRNTVRLIHSDQIDLH